MNITELCVKKPVFATMLICSMVIIGLASLSQLGVDLYPKADLPVVSISTILPGASPEEIESQVTKPIEEAVNTISGVDYIRSTSTEGNSRVTVHFILEKDIEDGVNDVRQKISAVLNQLPQDIESPVIEKIDPDAAPIMSILLQGNRSPKELSEIADKIIKRRLQTVPDVGSITLIGEKIREIQIFLNPNKLYAYNISVIEAKAAIQQQNLEIPAGKLTWDLSERGLRTLGKVDTIEELSEIIIADYKGAPVKIKDIGYVIDSTEETRSLSRVNGEPGIALLIRKQSGSNTIRVVDGTLERIKEIKNTLPPDIKMNVVRDQSRFIRKSISEVEHHLILGAIFVALVVLFFMRSFRACLVASISIPVSLIATFALMKYMNYTINNMTLMALSICTGIVIDDAIIVLENIFRFVEEKGMHPLKAAVEATKEIYLPVMATTISLLVIFIPIAFMQGVVGRFFQSFGFTAAFAIGISLFIALTLIPSLTARLFKEKSSKNYKSSKETGFYKFIDKSYDKALRWCLKHRYITVSFALLIVLTIPVMFKIVPTEFFPRDDMSEYEVIIETPPGSSIEKTDQIVKSIETEIQKLPSIKNIFTSIGGTNVTSGSIFINLLPLSERKISQKELMKETREIMENFPGLRSSVQEVSTLTAGGHKRTMYNLILQGPKVKELQIYAKILISKLSQVPGFVDLDTAQTDTMPEVTVNINREKASDLGINIMNIASALKTMVGGEKISTFREGNEQYDIRLRLDKKHRQSDEDVKALPIKTGQGQLIRLDNISEIKKGVSPSQIDHYNLERQITVVANLQGIAMGEAIQASDKAVENMNLPVEYKTYKMGYGKMMIESLQNFFLAALLSIIFIYIVLAAQFNSFSQPLIIMASIPLSIPFGLLSLYIFNQTINIYSLIGLLLLFGIVKKNAILQVDYTNTLIKQGKSVMDAVIEADHARLRPILMTTVTVIAGMLPIALGKGDGSAARASMATLIIGGQALCLFITLLVTPVLYTLATDLKIYTKKLFNKNN